MACGYYYRMKTQLIVMSVAAIAISVGAFIGLVFFADDSQGVRIGAWAQLTATIGTVLAAVFAYNTANANLTQARESRQAVAEATRPQLSVEVKPSKYGPKKGDSKTPVCLTVSNRSKFNVDDCRVEWELGRSSVASKELGPLFADPKPVRGNFGEPLSYADDLQSTKSVPLGVHEKFKASTIRVVLHYTSTFSNGEWLEVHYWTPTDTDENVDTSNWELEHKCDPPKWLPAET